MLKTLNSHERDKNIFFEEKGHIYTINGDKGYTSVTTWLKQFFNLLNGQKVNIME